MPVRRLVALSAALVAMLIALLVNVLPASAAKEYRAERFHSRVVVEPGGSIVVTETIRIVFGPDSFSRVYRELPTRRTDGITVLDATLDGLPLERGTRTGQFEIRRDDDGRRRVVWHFPETSNATRTFTLTYRVRGVASQDADSDVLAWRLLPSRHEYLIECASAEIEYPASAVLAGEPGFDPVASETQHESRVVRALRCPFERNRTWVATLRFVPRSLVPVAPNWQQRSQRNQHSLPLFLGLAALLLIAGAGGFLFFGLTHRGATGGDPDLRVTAQPDGLSPALAGALRRTGASAAWGDALGTILDLARRRVIRVEAQAPSGLFKKREVRITPVGVAPALAPHERTLMDLMFTTKAGRRASVTFDELARAVASPRSWKRVRTAVADELRAAGLLDPDRERTRTRLTVAGIAIMVLSVAGFVLGAAFVDRVGEPVMALPGAILLVGIAGVLTGATLSPLSEEGIARARQWQAFRRHLVRVADEARTSPASRTDLDRWLPYAAAFGTAVTWTRRLEKQGVVETPSWLAAVAGDGGSHPADMGAMVAILSSGVSAGSHAGDASHGGAGGGAAGGGSSGAA